MHDFEKSFPRNMEHMRIKVVDMEDQNLIQYFD